MLVVSDDAETSGIRPGAGAARRRPRPAIRWALRCVIVVLALAGALGGALLAGHLTHRVGPVDARFDVRLTGGHTRILVPPLGTLRIADHGGPVQLDATVLEVRPDAVRRLASNYPGDVTKLEDTVAGDVQDALIALGIRTVLASLGGAALVVGLATRRWRPVVTALAVVVAGYGGVGAYAVSTFQPDAIAQPRFTGLLASAPAAFGDVRDLQERFTHYRDEIAKLAGNVSQLYGVTATLPTLPPDGETIRVLWVADIHDNPEAFDLIRSVSRQFDVEAIIDSGDISDHGTPLENPIYRPIRDLGVPYVYVKGNHDSTSTVHYLERMPNVVVLDGNVRTVAGLAMTGIGDPRFTPTQHYTPAEEEQLLAATGSRLAADIDAEQPRADLAIVHDPATAGAAFGHVPLVLAGHLHHRDHAYRQQTLLLVQGSTGGAGLRTFDNGGPTPLDLSVLYFSRTTHHLVAYDDITVGGLGLTSAEIERHAVSDVEAHSGSTVPTAPPSSAPPSASASASASASVSPSDSAPTSPASSASTSVSASPSRSRSAPPSDRPPAATSPAAAP